MSSLGIDPHHAPEPPARTTSLTSPVIDYEPPAQPLATALAPASRCPAPTARSRHTPRRLRLVTPPADQQPRPGAEQFAHLALQRVLEVVDRRRPPAQLRPLMSPLLHDVVVSLAQPRHTAAASLTRVRLRAVSEPTVAEVFATYTRGPRVRAIAARIEFHSGRWQLTALQLG